MKASLEFTTREFREVAEAFRKLRCDHVVARSKDVADQLLKVENRYCVAQMKKNDELIAMFAYTPVMSNIANKFGNRVIYGAGWWASRKFPGSGAALIQRTLAHLEAKFLAVGLTDEALGLYRTMGWSLESLRNLHLCNNLPSDSPWSCMSEGDSRGSTDATLEIRFASWESAVNKPDAYQQIFDRYVLRDEHFYEERFINHPQLNYFVEECSIEGEVVCLMAYRLISTEHGVILRLIDLLIDRRLDSAELSLILERLKLRVQASVLEYRMFGQDLAVVEGAMRGPTCSFPIPQLVSPVVWEDSTLEFVCTDERLMGHVTRADGDQDRAN